MNKDNESLKGEQTKSDWFDVLIKAGGDAFLVYCTVYWILPIFLSRDFLESEVMELIEWLADSLIIWILIMGVIKVVGEFLRDLFKKNT